MAMVVQVVVAIAILQMNDEQNKKGKVTLCTHIELQ
jgi:hypothetical protein